MVETAYSVGSVFLVVAAFLLVVRLAGGKQRSAQRKDWFDERMKFHGLD